MAMLVARSVAECHLYMTLHPCDRCGEADFPWTTHEQGELPDGRMRSVYQGECPSCRMPRRFEFAVTGDPPPPAYGGTEPSQIIDPGEFLELAGRAAAYTEVPPDATPAQRRDARAAAEDAAAAVTEVLKFIPPGADAVAAEAFTSEAGRAAYAAAPEAFRRDRLEALLASRAPIHWRSGG